ncbi:hypothetical protein LguiB_027844 [Lonicera macranthoides]
MATTDYEINPDRIQNFFTSLETRKSLLTTITSLHKTLTDHFTTLDQTLTQKSQTLESQIKDFKEKSKESLELLESRENGIPERESIAAAKIEEQKLAAVNDIVNSESLNVNEGLRNCFRRMDSSGLISLLLLKRKETSALRAEIGEAMGEAVDAMRLVVDAVEEFVEMKIEGKVGMADRRWACGMLIQVVVGGGGGVGRSLRERAGAVLEKWKECLGGGEGSGGVGAGEATMFLQMVIGFGLKERFEEGFLRKLVLEFASRRDMPKLAVALNLGEKMEDIIDELVKSGKEIEAVYFATEAGLTERFAPVSLLKSCLRNCRKTANTISKNGNYSSSAVRETEKRVCHSGKGGLGTVWLGEQSQDEANNSELIATRAIIKCVEDHKLEAEFTIESLKKRVTQLEKAKADKKKNAASTSKPSNKRPHSGNTRGGGGGGGAPSFRPPKSGRFSNASPAFRQRNPPQAPPTRYTAAPYSYPSPSVYDGPSTAAFGGPGYSGAHTQSPVGLGTQYPPYAPQDVGAGGVRAGGSYAGQASYGGQSTYSAYDYAAAAAAPPSYPPSYPQ